jgi:hypothetical protein
MLLAGIMYAQGRSADAASVCASIWDQFGPEPRSSPQHKRAMDARFKWAMIVVGDKSRADDVATAVRDVLTEYRLVYGPENRHTLAVEACAKAVGLLPDVCACDPGAGAG